MPDELIVDVRPFGPDSPVLRDLAAGLLERPVLRDALARTRHRLLSVELLEPERKVARPRPPDRFGATIYDYTNDRTVFAEGSLRDADKLQVSESGLRPLPHAQSSSAPSRWSGATGNLARGSARVG